MLVSLTRGEEQIKDVPCSRSKERAVTAGLDSFKSKSTLDVGGKKYTNYNLGALAAAHPEVARLPYSLKVLLENLLRYDDGVTVSKDDIVALAEIGRESCRARGCQ